MGVYIDLATPGQLPCPLPAGKLSVVGVARLSRSGGYPHLPWAWP